MCYPDTDTLPLAILDVFKKHGHTELDTARVYGSGTSEEYLGKLQVQKQGLILETKLYPSTATRMGSDFMTHSAADIKKYLDVSLKALQVDSIEMFYLRA